MVWLIKRNCVFFFLYNLARSQWHHSLTQHYATLALSVNLIVAFNFVQHLSRSKKKRREKKNLRYQKAIILCLFCLFALLNSYHTHSHTLSESDIKFLFYPISSCFYFIIISFLAFFFSFFLFFLWIDYTCIYF